MKAVQEVLRLMVADLQDIRANLAAVAARPASLGAVQAARKQAIEDNQKSYESMLQKIDRLT
jgi:hypothetical protein